MSEATPAGADQQARLEVARAALRAVTEEMRRRAAQGEAIAGAATHVSVGPGGERSAGSGVAPASAGAGARGAHGASHPGDPEPGAYPPYEPPAWLPDSVREPGGAWGSIAPPPPPRVPAAGFHAPAVPFPTCNIPPDLPLRELEYAVVDVETTGGSALRGHRLTEVGVVVVRGDGTTVGEYGTLVNPGRPIPRVITRITNITNAMVAGAPDFRDVADGVRRATAGRVFVAHNAGFDLRFLGVELLRATGRPYEREPLCTVRLSRRLLPEVRRRSLDTVCRYFGIPIEGRHRALGDARATAILLLRLLERADEQGLRTWGMLDALLRKQRGRRRRSALPRSMESA